MDNDTPEATAEPVEPAVEEPKPFPWAEVISSVWLHENPGFVRQGVLAFGSHGQKRFPHVS